MSKYVITGGGGGGGVELNKPDIHLFLNVCFGFRVAVDPVVCVCQRIQCRKQEYAKYLSLLYPIQLRTSLPWENDDRIVSLFYWKKSAFVIYIWRYCYSRHFQPYPFSVEDWVAEVKCVDWESRTGKTMPCLSFLLFSPPPQSTTN